MKSRIILKRILTARKGQILRWIGTILAAILFLGILCRLDWARAGEFLLHLPARVVITAFLLYLSGMIANALRWYILLLATDIRVPFLEVVKIVFLGAFASNYLPSTIGGDTMRVISLMRFTSKKSVSFASVFLDRLINVAAMFTVLPFSLITFGSPLSILRQFFLTPVLLSGVSQHTYQRISKLRALLSRFPKWLQSGRNALQIWWQSPLILLGAFVISWISVFVIFLAIYLIARGLSIQVALYQVMGVTFITYFLTLLPISVNGYGIREVAITTLYMQLGTTLEQASTLAVITRFLMIIETLPGAIWLSDIVSTINLERGSHSIEIE